MVEINTQPAREELLHRYKEALHSFVARVQQDRHIIAAILYGSLAYDDIWEKSDIDILLIGKEENVSGRYYSLVENDITIQVFMNTRSTFKATLEGSLQGSMAHSIFANSILLFSTDDTIREYYRNAHEVGEKDRDVQLLKRVVSILPILTKAEKWLYVEGDPTYSFLLVLSLLPDLAALEVLLHNDIIGRETIQQAMKYNSTFFTRFYNELVHQPKTDAIMQHILTDIHSYLDTKIHLLFKPILTYLIASDSVRSTTEINAYLRQKLQFSPNDLEALSFTYEWLSRKGILQRVSVPVRLTEKSKVTLNEAAYYYDDKDKSKGGNDATDD